MNRLDDLRARYPKLGFAVYAIEPGKPVTLETHSPDGQVFTFRAATLDAALDKAFPPEPPANVFD